MGKKASNSKWQAYRSPLYLFGLLFLLFSTVAHGQVDSRVNIANYKYKPAEEAALELPKKMAADSFSYDPETGTYSIFDLKNGTYAIQYSGLTLKEMLDITGKQEEGEHMYAKARALDKLFSYRVPSLYAHRGLYNRVLQNSYADAPELVGHVKSLKDEIGKTVQEIRALRTKKLKDILPSLLLGLNGTFSFQAGYTRQEIANPSLPANLRVTGAPDFQVDMDFKGNLSLSEKLVLPVLALNNLSNFGEELFKAELEYKGGEDEIIKNISLIQTSFNSGSSLIPSTKSLLGVNMRVQFGRLFITGAIGQMRNQVQTTQIQNGKNKRKFKLRASDYDENQHFFLAQYFYDNYEHYLSKLPLVQSDVRITRAEVWVTNKRNETLGVRQGIAFMDMGEHNPYNPSLSPSGGGNFPGNDENTLFSILRSDDAYRDVGQVDQLLVTNGMRSVVDYEKAFMRKLSPSEYFLHEQLGYIMLNSPLQADDVLAVSFEYTQNGQVYQVGEFAIDNTPIGQTGQTNYLKSSLFLKMLKSTAHNVRLPLWNLMMKNVYTVGYGSTNKNDVDFQILYERPGGTPQNYLPTDAISPEFEGAALLEVTRMDALNPNAEGQPDGEFDFIDGVTFISSKGKIIFPHKRPFDEGLYRALQNPSTSSLPFRELYDTIQTIAKTYHNLDRFLIRGTSSSSLSNTDNIRIGFNLKPGSVRVFSGATLLVENQDYIVDYNLGTLRIINPIYLNSQTPVNVQYENNTQFEFRNYLFTGLRLDYYFKNKKIILGGTISNLNETPFYRKLQHNNDPINNTVYQLDLKYRDQMPWISRALSIFPGVSQDAPSSIDISTEVAMLVPGHSSQVGSGSSGGVFIDDFESSRSSISIKGSFLNWSLASTPQGSVDINNQAIMTEGSVTNSLEYGYNRARLSWYVIDPLYQLLDRVGNPLAGNFEELLKPETRQVYQYELFPNRSIDIQQSRLQTFDISFFPYERGPYNYDARPNSVKADGLLLNPKNRWGGIMRALNQIDFVSTNVEYMEFWLLDPFAGKSNSDGGNLYINLGNVSEDILKDGGKMYENGMPTPTAKTITTTSAWGKYPLDPRQVTFSFSNNSEDRPLQDLGLDGVAGSDERTQFTTFLSQLESNFGTASGVYQAAFFDPSSDNYRHYSDYTNEFGDVVGIIERYKYTSNPEFNSPVATSSSVVGSFSPPDSEDLNKDNIMNEAESYYQYHLPLEPGMQSASDFVADVRTVSVDLPGGQKRDENWYLIRIPLRSYHHTYGGIQGFQSIRFLRMFMHDFEDTAITLRFATMDFVINQWRVFNNEIDTLGGRKDQSNPQTVFNLQTVNVEENDAKTPVPYVMPPGVIRQSTISATSSSLLQNEQSLSFRFCDVAPGDARGAFKTLNLDLRNYEKMTMFIHAEGNTIANKSIHAVVRLGADLISNYYEIKIPLTVTPDGSRDARTVWPAENELNLVLSKLSRVKRARNLAGVSSAVYFEETQADGSVIAVLGNPTLQEVSSIMLGVRNSTSASSNACGEVWFNELRLSGFAEDPSWATTGRINLTLANLGKLSISGTYKSIGWGSLEQRLNERQQESNREIGLTANMDLHRMIPDKLGMQLPLYFSFNEEYKRPKYYPHESDVLLDEVLGVSRNKDSILNLSLSQSTSYKISLPSVQFFSKTPKWFPLSPSLFTFNYTYSGYQNSAPMLLSFNRTSHQGGINYLYAVPIGTVEPFKNIRSRSKWLQFIKKFNFRYLPSSIAVRFSFDRLFSKRINRNFEGINGQGRAYFNKYLKFERHYTINWSLTKSFKLVYTANQKSFVEENVGELDTQEKINHFWNEALHLGTNNYFKQKFTATYQLPFKFFPVLDWISGRAGYTSDYAWNLARISNLGHDVSNSQRITGSLLFNFTSLYYKIPAYRNAVRKDKNAGLLHKVTKASVGILTMIKRFQVNYSEQSSTSLPGWAPNILTWGQTFSSQNPGFDFTFGYIPDLEWFRNTAFRNNWIVKNPLLNKAVKQHFQQSIRFNLDISPIADLQILLTADVRFTKNFSVLAKDVSGQGDYRILNPYSTGSYSSSYLSFTLFQSFFSGSSLLELVSRIEGNRQLLSERLAGDNPYTSGVKRADGYYEGYNQYAQDVLLPSFIAAFTRTDVASTPIINHQSNSLRSNPFSGLSILPNWRILYGGLTTIPLIGDIFSSLSLSHAYSSRIEVSNYTSSIKFEDRLGLGWPSFLDPKTGNFIPYFLVPNITITEEYDPLFSITGVVDQWTFSLGIKRTRQASLNLVDYQISEVNILGVDTKVGWISREVRLPFNLGSKSQRYSTGNFTVDVDFNYESNRTQNARLEENIALTTSGMDRLNLNAQVGLIVDNFLNTQLYFEQLNTYPQLATSPPVFITRVGLKFVLTLNYERKVDAESFLPSSVAEYSPLLNENK